MPAVNLISDTISIKTVVPGAVRHSVERFTWSTVTFLFISTRGKTKVYHCKFSLSGLDDEGVATPRQRSGF